jgi:23S rRNA pseudouridine1911/1915/1917 synthase
MNFVENATRTKIQAAAKAGSIRVNKEVVKSNYKVKPLDEIKVFFEYPPVENILLAENIDLNIVFEDEDLIVVNKPAGMVVHPGHGNHSGTLINGLIYHFDNLPNNSSNRPGLVHRIDKDTSGLLVVAKNDNAMTKLSKQFADKTSKREYVALVWGNPKEDEGTIDEVIGRNPKNRLQNIVFNEQDSNLGKPAITHYKVIERFGYVTLISCRLETGRTHQIRVHLKFIGHTLFNDERYGGNLILKGTTFTKYKQFVDNCFKVLPRQALHAKSLGFIHPTSNKFMEFESEIPDDFKLCLDKWTNYSKHQM